MTEYEVLPLAESEAIELFCRRSRARPDDNVAELCRRLDNLPLGIEFAAARMQRPVAQKDIGSRSGDICAAR